MSTKFTVQQLDEVMTAFVRWLADNTENVVSELSQELVDTAPIIVADPSFADVRNGQVIMTIFTARAAMRKAVKWFEDSTDWTQDRKIQFLTVTVQELLAAIVNCDTSLAQLNVPDRPGINEYLTDPDGAKGGAS